MRKLSFFLTFALVLSLAYGALAQTHNAIIKIDAISNTYNDGGTVKLNAGKSHAFSLRFNLTASSTAGLWIGSNAWEVYSTDGADWVNMARADGPLVTALSPSVAKFKKFFTSTNDGVTYTQTASGGATQPGGRTGSVNRVAASFATVDATGLGGYTGGTSDIAQIFTISSLAADAGKHLCFDSLSGHGTVAWEWAAPGVGQDFPQWDNGLGVSGPRCLEIFVVPNLPPEWCAGNTGNISVNHCAAATYQLCATDPDPEISGGVVNYAFVGTEYGTLNTATGAWSWSGASVPQTGFTDVVFVANDSQSNSETNFTLHVTHLNNPPTIACPSIKTVSINTCKTQTVTIADADACDALTVSFVGFSRPFAGTYTITGNVIELCPVTGDENAAALMMTVQVSDGAETATCDVPWNVIAGSPYAVSLEKIHDQIQGQYTDMAITLHKFDVAQGLGGFDFLVAYDASALSFQLALEGDIYDQCNWEYFTYRYGPFGNCGNACPSGMVRVIGIAETNNGGVHPGCDVGHVGFINSVPVTLAYLRFLVSNDRTLECQYVPVRFFWYDCGDNVLSNYNGSELYLSEKVYDYSTDEGAFLENEISNKNAGFPTFQGAQLACAFEQNGKVAKPNVDFQNGGVDIICADSIDAPGDVNLNGIPNEIADAVMFTNYFINGLAAFGTHIDGSIAATDVNKDGITLSVADLVYLIRVIIGDALPYDKISPVAARVTVGNGVFNVNQEMGAAYVVVAGNVTPTLLAENMEMKYAFNGANTNILVYSLEGNSFTGDFLRAEGNVVSSEFAAFNGAPVVADVMPANFELHQNYPNPFNPTTTIKIEIPKTGIEWKLNIYNVTGQLVQSFAGVSRGYDVVTWDASNVSSGVYFYKLTAGDFSATKKAVLLK